MTQRAGRGWHQISTLIASIIGIFLITCRDLSPPDVGLFLAGAGSLLLLPVIAAEMVLSGLPVARLTSKQLRRIAIGLVVGGPFALALYLLGSDALAPMPIVPLAVFAIVAAVTLDRLHPAVLVHEDPRYWFAACIASLELLTILIWTHLSQETFAWVRPGTEQLHLFLFAATWGTSIGLLHPWASRILARRGSCMRPPWFPLWTGVSIIVGLSLIEMDRSMMVGLYPAIHVWLGVLGVLTIDAAFSPWLVPRLEGTERSPKVPSKVRKLASSVALLGLVLGAAHALTTDKPTLPSFRASLAETALGANLLDLWSTQPSPQSGERDTRNLPASFDYKRYSDEKWPTNNLNILLISVDALRADALPAPGSNDTSAAPNLAELAKTCADFRWNYSPSSRTSTSMGSLMIGRYNANIQWRLWIYSHGKIINPRDPTQTNALAALGNKYIHTTMPDLPPRGNLAQRLKAEGFYTLATPYAGHNQFFKDGYGYDVGFDEFMDLTEKKAWSHKSTSIPIAQAAASQLKPHLDRRWFQWIHFYDPHEAGADPARYRDMVLKFDEGLGRTLTWLERQGVRDRTAIFIVADHGEALGEHRQRFHGTSLYEEQVRVPMLVCIPGLKPAVFNQRTTIIDATATILALTGADTSELDGVNLLPLISEGRYPENRPIIIELSRYMSRSGRATSDIKALVRGGWKYIWDRRKNTRMLFNLNDDPGELKNLLDSEPERTKKFAADLETVILHGEQHYPLP